jgi:hypothetical protein
VAVWLVGVMALTYEYKKHTWFVLLLGTAVASLERGRSHRDEGSPSRTAATGPLPCAPAVQ